MTLFSGEQPLIVVVGSGGVGKTTLAASLGLQSARQGTDTLVMTFDPSLRLKDSLGVGDSARDEEIEVPLDREGDSGLDEGGGQSLGRSSGRLAASLLDAGKTFDRLVDRYAPDAAARDRILDNRFYRHLSGSLSGVLEYMAVERLFEVNAEGRYGQIILDTPPARQALDFLEAPSRIVGFLDSGALRFGMKDWFDGEGRLRPARRLGVLGRGLEGLLDRVVGIDFLRDMLEFFQAFGPLYEGFRQRALEVEELLRSPRTLFILVSGPGEERIPDSLFFARRLKEAGYRLGPIFVNRMHMTFDLATEGRFDGQSAEGVELMKWLGDQDRAGFERLRSLAGDSQATVAVPLLSDEPTDLGSLERLGADLLERLAAASARLP